MYLCGEVGDIFRLAKGHAEGLQPWEARRQHRFRVDCAKAVQRPLPDGGLRPGGDLLTDDMMHHRREQVAVHGTIYVPDAVNDCA